MTSEEVTAVPLVSVRRPWGGVGVVPPLIVPVAGKKLCTTVRVPECTVAKSMLLVPGL